MTRSTWRHLTATAALAAAITVAAAGLSGAFASEAHEARCRMAPGQTALTDQELRTKLAAQGYDKVRGLEREGGCVEAKGIDASGKRFELHIQPDTGAIVSRK